MRPSKHCLPSSTRSSAGRFGGAAVNQTAGLLQTHKREQGERLQAARHKTADTEAQVSAAIAAGEKTVAENERALQLKKDQESVKQAAAAAKAAQKAAKAATKSSSKKSSSSASSKSLSKTNVITLLKMGIYDESFAGILGVEDAQVRAYLNGEIASFYAEKNSTENKLPGTYKPPLR